MTVATVRAAAPRNFWKGSPKTLKHVGMENFRVSTLRRGKPHMLLAGIRVSNLSGGRFVREFSGLVEQVSWLDESAVLTGEVTLREPAYAKYPLDVIDGDEVVLEYAPTGGKYVELWRMRCREPSYGLDSGQVSLKLTSELQNLQESVDDFRYAKGKKKPKGWYVHEVIIDVARRYKIRIGKIATTRHRVTKYVRLNFNGMDVIREVLTKEAVNEKRRFVIRYHRGKLHILPRTRNPQLLELGRLITDGTFAKTRRKRQGGEGSDAFATAVTVRGKNWKVSGTDTKKAKKLKGTKLQVLVVSQAAVARYGYIHRVLYSPDANSVAALRKQGQMYLAEVARADRSLTVRHPGIPTLRRGHALKVFLPQEGLNQIVYVRSVAFDLSPRGFDMELTLFFDDPYIDRRKQLIIDKLTETARERNTSTEKATKTKKTTPKPATAATRAAKIPAAPGKTNAERLAGKFGG